MMKEYSFKKIDAFATERSEGNPAGYIWLDSLNSISEKEMLQIAKELKGFVNEVGYIAQIGNNEFVLKYFSAEREVDFCGHATIAIMYDLVKTKNEFNTLNKLLINTNRGQLEVENKLESEDSVFIMSPEPIEKDLSLKTKDIASKLRIKKTEIATAFPVSIINAGLSTLIIPIKDLQSILNIAPDLEELKEFCLTSGVDIIEVYTSDVHDYLNNFRTRVFAPTFGYLEDPATGSGNSAFGYYLIKNKIWNTETIRIEQNGQKDNFNMVKLRKQTDENGKPRICFGGGAITRIEGKYITYM
jgi:PhzF family phenazine biosynthesis protein